MIHIIDFGLSKHFIDPKSEKHIEYKEGKELTGTVRYASLNTQLGIEQSRRDDLESIGLMLMYFNRGTLPWQGLQVKNKKDKYDLIKKIKVNSTPEVLCKEFNKEFSTYLTYCRSLEFNEKPDYQYLRKIFRDLANKEKIKYDNVYDWTPLINTEDKKATLDNDELHQISSEEDKAVKSDKAKIPLELRHNHLTVKVYKKGKVIKYVKEPTDSPGKSPTTK